MKWKFVVFFTYLSLNFSLFGMVEFEPSQLKLVQGSWTKPNDNFIGEAIFDCFYGDRLVFRVLDRFLPAVNSLIIDAIAKHRKIGMVNAENVFIDKKEDVKNILTTVDPECSFIEIEANKIVLSTSFFGRFKKYYINFISDNNRITISKHVYLDLKEKQSFALASNKYLRIDTNKLRDSKGCTTLMTHCPNNK